METTTGGTTLHLDFLKCQTSPNGSFRIAYPPKKSKTLEFFDDLYTYPPKFRVKWDTIDELHEDLFMSYNYRVRNPNLPFMGVLTDFFSTEDNGVVKKINYPCFVKPRWGRGSRGAQIINNLKEMEAYLTLSNYKQNEIIFQDLLKGEEYTVSMVSSSLNIRFVLSCPS